MRTPRLVVGLIIVSAMATSVAPAQNFASFSGDLGISANLWLSGDISLHEWGAEATKNDALLLRVFYDAYLIEKLSMGLFLNYSPATVGSSDMSVNMLEVGFSIKPRFIIANGSAAIKPGINIGYRTASSDNSSVDAMDGLALNASIEVQFASSSSFLPFMEIGFLTQPVGGNDITGVSWAPIFYLGGGVAF